MDDGGRRCWLDRFGEFVECCDDSQVLMSGVNAEFVGLCCVVRSGDVSVDGDGGLVRSDRGGEFVECGDEAKVLVSGVGSEFVVAAS